MRHVAMDGTCPIGFRQQDYASSQSCQGILGVAALTWRDTSSSACMVIRLMEAFLAESTLGKARALELQPPRTTFITTLRLYFSQRAPPCHLRPSNPPPGLSLHHTRSLLRSARPPKPNSQTPPSHPRYRCVHDCCLRVVLAQNTSRQSGVVSCQIQGSYNNWSLAELRRRLCRKGLKPEHCRATGGSARKP